MAGRILLLTSTPGLLLAGPLTFDGAAPRFVTAAASALRAGATRPCLLLERRWLQLLEWPPKMLEETLVPLVP